jgi:hypothetical protein
MESFNLENSHEVPYDLKNLDDSHPKENNVDGLKIQLMNHQRTSLYHCLLIEKNEGILINETYYFSTFGILSCKVGSGKSFVVLAMIIKKPLVNYNRISNGYGGGVITHSSFKKINTLQNTVSANIILIPHNLLSQWTGYITKYTNIRYLIIHSSKDYSIFHDKVKKYTEETESSNRRLLFEDLTENIVYLITNKFWNVFALVWNNSIKKNVSRIFVDEVHAINIPNSMKLQANFVWFISSSLNDLFRHSNNGFIKDYINMWSYYSSLNHNVIKNSDEYIDSSIQLESPHTIMIRCKTSRLLNIFSGIITDEVRSMLLAEDVEGVISTLGILTVSESNIIQVLCKNLQNDLENARLIHETKKIMNYSTEQMKEESIAKSQDKIDKINEKIMDVQKRISECDIDPIMLIDIMKPVITGCCNNKFDLESITAHYSHQEKNNLPIVCPLCRAPLDLKKLLYVGEFKGEKVSKKKHLTEWNSIEHTKIENLEHLLRTRIEPTKRILIFSEFEGNVSQIGDAFKKAGRINLYPLKGSIGHITNLIEQYNRGDIRSLFLNATYCGSGLNLEKTDVVIIMHKMSQDNMNQVVGRAQRLGRKGKLDIFCLYAENE